MTTEDKIRLTVDLVGEERARALNVLLSQSKAETKALGDAFKATGGDLQDFIKKTGELASDQQKYRDAIKQIRDEERAARAEEKRQRAELAAQKKAEDAAETQRVRALAREKREAARATAEAERQARTTSGGNRMMEVGRFVQDFQAAGVYGVLNNLQGLTTALGWGAGLGGALTIAGVALQTFMPQIKEFFATLTEGGVDATGVLTKLKEELSALERDPVKVSIDPSSLAMIKAQISDIEDAVKRAREAGGRPSAVEKAGKGVVDAFAEFGGYNEGRTGQQSVSAAVESVLSRQDPRVAALAGQIRKSEEYMKSDEYKRALAQPGGGGVAEMQVNELRVLRNRLAAVQEGIRTQAAGVLGQAMQGDQGGVINLANMVRDNPDEFARVGASPNLFNALMQSTPAAVRGREAFGAAQKRAEASAKAAQQAQAQQQRDEADFIAEDEGNNARRLQERRKAASAEAQANARAAAQQAAVLQAGMPVPLDAQLAGGANPFAMAEGLATELAGQGVEKNAAMEQAAKMVEQAIMQVKMANAEQNATIMGMLSSLSQGLGSIAQQQQGFAQQGRRMQQNPMGGPRRNR